MENIGCLVKRLSKGLLGRLFGNGGLGLVAMPPHPQARQRKAIAESRGEDANIDRLWPEWSRHERRHIRRGHPHRHDCDS